MNHRLIRLLFLCILLSVFTGGPQPASAQSAKTNRTDKGQVTAKKPRPIPFHGTVKALDRTAKTLTVGSRVFQITAQTKISKDGKPSTLEAGVSGDQVSGSYRKGEDGKLYAGSVYFGEKAGKTMQKQVASPQ